MLEPMPGPELVASLTWLAGAHYYLAAYSAAIATVGRALTLADQLGLPVPGRALVRGGARSFQGDLGRPHRHRAGSRPSNRRRQREGCRSAAAHLDVHPLVPGRAHGGGHAVRTGASIRRRTWPSETAPASTASSVAALIECGRLDEALERAETLLPLLRESGNRYDMPDMLSAQATALAERGLDAREPA